MAAMNKLCECANLEWKPEHYSLEHHPDCLVNAQQLGESLARSAENIRVNLESIYGRMANSGTHLTIYGGFKPADDDVISLHIRTIEVPSVMSSLVSIGWWCHTCGEYHSRPIHEKEGEPLLIECLNSAT